MTILDFCVFCPKNKDLMAKNQADSPHISGFFGSDSRKLLTIPMVNQRLHLFTDLMKTGSRGYLDLRKRDLEWRNGGWALEKTDGCLLTRPSPFSYIKLLKKQGRIHGHKSLLEGQKAKA